MRTNELMDEARITLRQVNYWVTVGYLRPSGGMSGSGTVYEFEPRRSRWPN